MIIRYQARPTDLTEKCDGRASNITFVLQHAPQYKVGCILAVRHNKVRNALSLMGTKELYSYYIRDRPNTPSSCYR